MISSPHNYLCVLMPKRNELIKVLKNSIDMYIYLLWLPRQIWSFRPHITHQGFFPQNKHCINWGSVQLCPLKGWINNKHPHVVHLVAVTELSVCYMILLKQKLMLICLNSRNLNISTLSWHLCKSHLWTTNQKKAAEVLLNGFYS